ncbi:DUF3142 domain-containing protein [Dyella halodurans]|uniref:DUF3142 domain-containing protein n=1 Tax=Dyella halodurans TaxID=1920171 RepID=A0ABV9C5V3_9GAMM|nr:DUF3142 domain-containing protein [Dyella halodurans]
MSSRITRLLCRLPWSLAGVVVFAAALAACSGRKVALSNDAYVWQRQWTPSLTQAVRQSNDVVTEWRVLAGQLDEQGNWRTFSPDWVALAATGKPVVSVVRIEAQLAPWDDATLLAEIQPLLDAWRGHGLTLAGVEIDCDCATERLPAYAEFLAALRARMKPGERLSITASPSWLGSTALDGVLAQADEAVLQVHAVQSPRAGLFNPSTARASMADFASRTHKPWRVALPTYGMRGSVDEQGRITTIESEQSTWVAGASASELFADPQAMQRFVAAMESDAPRGLAGIAWFRLPTDDDRRAWSLATWRAVLARLPLKASLLGVARSKGGSALQDLVLINTGNADVSLPLLVRVNAACDTADGINGYTLLRTARGLFLQRTQGGLLRAGHQLNIGWLRCGRGTAALHIE